MKSTINFGYLIFLSVVAALGGFLFGYDTAVISGTIAQVTQLFQLDTLQQGWYVGCALVGSIVGVLFAGILSDKLGRKLTMVISAVLFSTSALGCALSADFTQLVVYRIIGGVGIGVVSIVSPLYISELAVAQYRGRLVSLYQLAVADVSLRSIGDRLSQCGSPPVPADCKHIRNTRYCPPPLLFLSYPFSYFLLSSSASRIISAPLSNTAVTALLNASVSGLSFP